MGLRESEEHYFLGKPYEEFEEWCRKNAEDLKGKSVEEGGFSGLEELGKHHKTCREIADKIVFYRQYGGTKMEDVLGEAEKWRRELCHYDPEIARKYHSTVPEFLGGITVCGYFEGNYCYRPFFAPAVERFGSYTRKLLSEEGKERAESFLNDVPKYLPRLRKKLAEKTVIPLESAFEEIEKFLSNPSEYSRTPRRRGII